MVSPYLSQGLVRDVVHTAENAGAAAAVGYLGKVTYDYATALLSGQAYTSAANLSSFASGSALLYLVHELSKQIFKFFDGEKDQSAGRHAATAIVAVQLTSLAVIPLNINLAVKGILNVIPAVYIGEKIADKIRHALHPAAQ